MAIRSSRDGLSPPGPRSLFRSTLGHHDAGCNGRGRGRRRVVVLCGLILRPHPESVEDVRRFLRGGGVADDTVVLLSTRRYSSLVAPEHRSMDRT